VPILASIFDNAYQKSNEEQDHEVPSRAINIGLVLGPSGSGKTFFALQYLAERFLRKDLNNNDENRVTLYFYARRTGIHFIQSNGEKNPKAAQQLCDWIRLQAARSIGWEGNNKGIETTLDMHVCVIIDEAGDLDVKDWFEDKQMLLQLCDAAANLATSVAVVAAGTALTGREMSSVDDAFVFRMRQWRAEDLVHILPGNDERFTGDLKSFNAAAAAAAAAKKG
jgi:hypothetical protein